MQKRSEVSGYQILGTPEIKLFALIVAFVVVDDFAEESPCLQILVESPGLLSYLFLLLHCLL